METIRLISIALVVFMALTVVSGALMPTARASSYGDYPPTVTVTVTQDG